MNTPCRKRKNFRKKSMPKRWREWKNSSGVLKKPDLFVSDALLFPLTEGLREITGNP